MCEEGVPPVGRVGNALINDRLEMQVVLFMKGTKQEPKCGFSNTCVQIFNSMGVPFESVRGGAGTVSTSSGLALSFLPALPLRYLFVQASAPRARFCR